MTTKGREVFCNKCEKKMGFHDVKGEFVPIREVYAGGYIRFHLIDTHPSYGLHGKKFECDYCDECSGSVAKYLKEIKVFAGDTSPDSEFHRKDDKNEN